MRTRIVLAALVGFAIGFSLSQISVSLPVNAQEEKPPAKTADVTELDGLKASATEFEKAFNAGDAKAIAKQFTEDAEACDEDGSIIKGLADIEARFEKLFKDFPKARIVVELTSLRKLGPDVAIEDGYSATTLDPDEPGSRSPYTVMHVKRDGKWLIASVRDFPEESSDATAHEQLQTLKWLVGHWVDESSGGRVETTCQWSDDGNYLLQNYAVRTRRGESMQGTQRIAWDPLRRTIRSWAFDQSGAFTEATWTPREEDEGWILRAAGVTPEGQGVSVTRFITPINKDAFQIESTGLVVGAELLPDTSVRVVRAGPTPAQ